MLVVHCFDYYSFVVGFEVRKYERERERERERESVCVCVTGDLTQGFTHVRQTLLPLESHTKTSSFFTKLF
jgi:hypothetical protein